MTRHFRNADYHIIIENPQHIESGKPIVSVDGVQIEGNRLPDFADGSRHEVESCTPIKKVTDWTNL